LVEWFLGAVGGNPPAGQGSSTLAAAQAITMNNVFQIGGARDVQFDYRSGGMTVQGVVQYVSTPAGVPGDYNENGVVDAADYLLWRDGGPLANEGGVTPGTTTPEDYFTWRANFGRSAGIGGSLAASTAVPEPTILLLASFVPSVIFFLAGRRRRQAVWPCDSKSRPNARAF
jgi:hypothetical protein